MGLSAIDPSSHAEDAARWEWAARESIFCVALSHDGKQLTTGGTTGKGILWDRAGILNDPDPTPSQPATKPSLPASASGAEEEDCFA
jgi:hypothetical protein